MSTSVVWQPFQRLRGYHTYSLLYLASSFLFFPQTTLLSLKTPSLWQAWQGNFVFSSVTGSREQLVGLFCWKNSCSFSGNSVRTFQSFVSLCWIRYCLASWVLCSQDGWRITVMSSLLPVTSITYWWSLWQLNVINRQNSFMIAQWGMEVRSSSSSNWFIEHKHLSDWSVLIFNWIICYSFQLNSNAQLSFPQRMSVGGLMKGDRLSLVSYRAVRLHQSFPGKPYSRLFHRYSWISAFHTYLFPALLTHWNRAKLI